MSDKVWYGGITESSYKLVADNRFEWPVIKVDYKYVCNPKSIYRYMEDDEHGYVIRANGNDAFMFTPEMGGTVHMMIDPDTLPCGNNEKITLSIFEPSPWTREPEQRDYINGDPFMKLPNMYQVFIAATDSARREDELEIRMTNIPANNSGFKIVTITNDLINAMWFTDLNTMQHLGTIEDFDPSKPYYMPKHLWKKPVQAMIYMNWFGAWVKMPTTYRHG